MSSENQALHTVASNITKFSTDFYKALAENEKSNFICSPISVSMVLSMVTYGARGNTEKELRSALGLSEDDQLNKDGFQSLIDSLNAIEIVVLNLANKIYFNTNFNVKPEFKKLTETSFRSVSETIDFGNTSEASKNINSWCEEKTNNCIKNVVQPGDLIDSQMVLVNAVYFKGEWKWQFDPKRTKPEPFHIDKNTTKDVPMMFKKARYNNNELADLDAKFIELRYKSNDQNHPITMFIILPNEVDGINTVETKLDTINFKDLHENSNIKECELWLPKFKVESTLDLEKTLSKVGLKGIFEPSADFSGIDESGQLSVSKVIQKTFLEVDEVGSEAASASVMLIRKKSCWADPVSFNVNRPFLCVIVATETGTLLFNGRIIDPTAH